VQNREISEGIKVLNYSMRRLFYAVSEWLFLSHDGGYDLLSFFLSCLSEGGTDDTGASYL
jgi:hypothetical protein